MVITFMELTDFLKKVIDWAGSLPDCSGFALLGSHARGEATPASDIDLVFITTTPQQYLRDTGWLGQFGEILRTSREDWGKVQSVRVWYKDGYEVEFGIADLSWVSLPLDEGTAKTISDGMVILYEKGRCLSSAIGSKRDSSEEAQAN